MDPSSPEPSTSSKTERSRPERKTKQRNELDSMELLKLKVKWSDQEIRTVLKGLDELGVTRINTIAEQLPHKTPEQLKSWLWKLSRTSHRLKQKDKEMDAVSSEESSVGVALGTIERGKKTGINSRQLSAISKSLLLISTLEEHPPAPEPQDIDFKKLYTALYMALKGYPLPRMNVATHVFFVESIELLLKAAKLNPIDASTCESSSMPLESLAGSVVLNPLSMEVDFLQAKVIPETAYQALHNVKIKNWLSPHDWSLL